MSEQENETLAQDTAPGREQPPGDAARPQPSISGFRLLRRLGSGGMGDVFEAEQLEPVRRRVAIKVVKWGMDTREVLARFDSERQALALMDHPAIARAYDAGSTDRGRPYFVMELVAGIPITEYCDKHRVPARERLELFIKVCEGVQHAHQKGIIHRDLKPSNVLVVVQDDKPAPKIIDFGVAKATAQHLTERTVFTEHGQLIGTPEYMSPEQAEMTGLDIDTRTDVYSLGVILYELLTGALPFDSKELRGLAMVEIQRRIRETEPAKPSTRFGHLDRDTSTRTAQNRAVEPSALAKNLAGDLDWIVMTAMDKDRTRRYSTANALALEVERYLADEPVRARPPSTTYRVGKFVRRHRLEVFGAALLLLALIVGVVGTSVGLVRARRAEARALAEAETASQVSDFLVDLFEVSDPSEALGNTITAREVLDRGARRIREDLADQPEIQARLRTTMGKVYTSLGLFPEAETLLVEAMEVQRETLGEDHPNTLDSMERLGILYLLAGRWDEAEPLFLEVLESRRRRLGEDDLDTLSAMNGLGVLYKDEQRLDEAEALLAPVLEAHRRLLGDDDPATLDSMHNLAAVIQYQGRFDEAEPLSSEALEGRRRVLGNDHPETQNSKNTLARLYYMQGRPEKSAELLADALATARRVEGEDHPTTLTYLTNLGILYRSQGLYDEAEPMSLEALESSRRVLGNDHPKTMLAMAGLASLYEAQHRYDEAEPLFLESLEARRRVLGEDHPDTLASGTHLCDLYRKQGRLGEAEPLCLATFETSRGARGEDDLETLIAADSLAVLLRLQGRYAEAEPLQRQTLEAMERTLGEGHTRTLHGLRNLGLLHRSQGRYPEAEADFEEALARWERGEQTDRQVRLEALVDLAGLRALQDRGDEALELLTEARDLGWSDPDRLEEPAFDTVRDRPDFRALLMR